MSGIDCIVSKIGYIILNTTANEYEKNLTKTNNPTNTLQESD